MNAIVLSPLDLATASLLVLASAALSLALSLGVHRPLLIAAVRMVVQLLVVGLLLRQVFGASSGLLTGAVIVVMLVAASREAGARQDRRLAGAWHYATTAISVVAATVGVTVLALTTALRPMPWYDARHAIPLTGIILGTVMNAASLGLNAVFASVTRERVAIEARIALGADRWTAFEDIIRRAVRAGVIPTINQMAAAGIITMPGIMTGQILGGMDPIDAGRYQILLMLLLAGAGFAGVTAAVYLAVWRLTDERDRLRLDRLGSAPLKPANRSPSKTSSFAYTKALPSRKSGDADVV